MKRGWKWVCNNRAGGEGEGRCAWSRLCSKGNFFLVL